MDEKLIDAWLRSLDAWLRRLDTWLRSLRSKELNNINLICDLSSVKEQTGLRWIMDKLPLDLGTHELHDFYALLVTRIRNVLKLFCKLLKLFNEIIFSIFFELTSCFTQLFRLDECKIHYHVFFYIMIYIFPQKLFWERCISHKIKF